MLLDKLRRPIRKTAYTALYYGGIIPRARRVNRHFARILTYHSVAPEESYFTKGLGVTVKPETFTKHIKYIRKHYNVVSLAELVKQLEQKDLAERLAVITFDDGFADNYQYAMPILRKFDIPATIFLVGAGLDNKTVLWMHRLNYLANACGIEKLVDVAELVTERPLRQESSPSSSLQALRNMLTLKCNPSSRDRLINKLCETLGVSPDNAAGRDSLYLSISQVNEMSSQGISFGCHGATHSAFSALSTEEQIKEISDGCKVITQAMKTEHLPLAYPFGEERYYTSTSRDISLDTGHKWLMACNAGWVSAKAHPSDLDRVKVEEEAIPEFAARIERVYLRNGITGLLGRPLI